MTEDRPHDDDPMADTIDTIEQRRAPRVACQLEVQIEGVDPRPVMRLGNLSTLGLMIRTDEVPGKVGDLVYLRIRSSDLRDGASTMAKIVRVVRMEGAGSAVAFHFLPESEGVKASLDGLFRWVLTDQIQTGDLRVAHKIPMQIQVPGGDEDAAVRELAVRRMLLETSWELAPGEQVQLVFKTFGGATRIPFEGVVRESTPHKGSFQARVDVLAMGERAGGADERSGILDSMDLILTDLARGSPERETVQSQALAGSLERIPLVSLLTLLAAEELSGELRLDRDGELASILLADGDVVNVEPEREVSELLQDWAQRAEGAFRFLPGPVEVDPEWLPRSTRALVARLRFSPR